jgi:hypothetical protein
MMAEQKENKAATAMVVVLGLLGLGLVIAKGRDEEEKEAKVEGEAEAEAEAQPSELPNGESKGIPLASFDPLQLSRGTLVEMEHTTDPKIAQRIAADHLTEDPNYYDKLEEAGL